MATTLVARLAVTTMIALGALAWWPAGVTAQETIRIGCPTKTYFPTILATVAKEKGLFEKEGLRPEITIYRGGGETFEAIAANSADLGPVAVRWWPRPGSGGCSRRSWAATATSGRAGSSG